MLPFPFYNLKDYVSALKYFTLANQSKNPEVVEKGMRYKALSLLVWEIIKSLCRIH